MTEPRPQPRDIEPERRLPKILGFCLAAFAALLAYPPVSQVMREGVDSFGDWPDVFDLFILAAIGLGGLGLYLIVTPFETGARVRFHDGGFTVHERGLFSEGENRFEWSGVREFGRISWGNHSDYVVRLHSGREFTYRSAMFRSNRKAFLDTLVKAAAASGYHAERATLNLVLYEKEKWLVRPADPPAETG